MTRPSDVTTLVFDVLGTLLDEDGALAAAAAEASQDSPGVNAADVARDWSQRLSHLMDAVVAGRAAYETIDALRRRALVETASEFGLSLQEPDLDRWGRAAHRQEPFPDTTAAFGRLAERYAMVGLTNANLSQAFDMSTHGGLRWNMLLSGEVVPAFKPDPRMYAYAIERLELDPRRAFFVAAHPWDLDAAAAHGFNTAYLDRADSAPTELAAFGERFDVVVPDLAALADVLT